MDYNVVLSRFDGEDLGISKQSCRPKQRAAISARENKSGVPATGTAEL